MENDSLKLAIEDVSLIKSVMQKSMIELKKLSNLFLWVGFLLLGKIVILITKQIIIRIIFSRIDINKDFSMFTNAEIIIHKTSIILLLLLFVALIFLFFKKRHTVKNSQFTLQLFDLWGVILFLMPVFTFVGQCLLYLINPSSYSEESIYPVMIPLFSVIGFAFLSLGVFITGRYINNKILIFASIILVVMIPVVFLLTANSYGSNISHVNMIFSITNTYLDFIKIAVFLAMGFYLKFGVKYGD